MSNADFNAETYQWARCVPELLVSDFDISLSFYTKIGFIVEFDRREKKFAYLSYQGAQIMIDERHNGHWETAEMVQPFGRGINLQIETDNLDALIAHIKTHDFQLYSDKVIKRRQIGPKEEGWCEFLIQDPDGYLLRFLQPFL
jgi:predicted enzyme related to lactoylglutathione lyase